MQENSATGRLESLKERAVALKEDLEQRFEVLRSRFWFVDSGLHAFRRDNEIGGFVLAGAIAFRLFVYLLPMFLLVLVVAAAAFSIDPSTSERVGSMAGLSGYVVSTLANATETSRKSMWILVPATIWALVVAGRSAARVIALAHSSAWRCPTKPTRTYASLGFAIFTLMCTAVAGVTRYVRSQGLVLVAAGFAIALFTGLWLVASLRLPRDPQATWFDLLPGAVLVAVGTQGLYLFNVLYLQHKVDAAREAYGALGMATTGLLWLYLLGRLCVAAPVLNAVLFERRVSLASDST
ncbi:MAG: YihY/virulence factor BrkB family protein [Microthrixaceae bacterium]|nr:YihY/virulence factor BrkB family protein [Microthrixaceae bacterium]